MTAAHVVVVDEDPVPTYDVTFTADGEPVVGQRSGYSLHVRCAADGCRWDHHAAISEASIEAIYAAEVTMTLLHQQTRSA